MAEVRLLSPSYSREFTSISDSSTCEGTADSNGCRSISSISSVSCLFSLKFDDLFSSNARHSPRPTAVIDVLGREKSVQSTDPAIPEFGRRQETAGQEDERNGRKEQKVEEKQNEVDIRGLSRWTCGSNAGKRVIYVNSP